MMFEITNEVIQSSLIQEKYKNIFSGAAITFEGRVRDHNEGKKVSKLVYEIYPELALQEGKKIIEEARSLFNIHDIYAVHRCGELNLGEVAVLIHVVSKHRDEVFSACRYVIDEIKKRLPVWKKEFYVDGYSEWVYCKHEHS